MSKKFKSGLIFFVLMFCISTFLFPVFGINDEVPLLTRVIIGIPIWIAASFFVVKYSLKKENTNTPNQ
ncbi:hypothetical protein [Flavobacterium beibuense]|uniref:Uncharacterized protein n=1 Tax=Flavobacterium beibuense TaxID=657326 RepID=A0A444W774_9FLAO|nr:hypothetical protein [Flavobacterium beibuense]RYJ41721.1 hypothetical protein NU09_2646 [Flavobacterium beibuense]